jgi:DNA-binding NtrC family response regulator
MTIDKILVVGKNPDAQQLAQRFARQLYAADDVADLWPLLDNVEPHLIFFDADTSQSDLHAIMPLLQKKQMTAPVLAVCPPEQTACAEHLLRAGVFDYIHHHNDTNRMGQIIDRINDAATQTDADFFVPDCPASLPMVGKSPAIQKTLNLIRLVASSACNPVLIVGETGTGKELAARAIHTLRNSSGRQFVAVNCAALTVNLLESELFGHVKGAFTSADRDKTGLLELAGNGTLFLDEISEMPLDLQAKLLRVLQEKTFRKVGGTEEIRCNATLIASSNRNLIKEVEHKRFRQDLYYRLSICPIMLAPLRSADRKEDILLLAEYFIQNSTICPEKNGKIKGLTKLATETLLRHDWPGNIRELRNVVERAILLEQSDRIGTANLILHPDSFDHAHDGSSGVSMSMENDFSLERAEKELVAKALQKAGWQKTRAASLLGITRATLYAKLKQYNIRQPLEPCNSPVEADPVSV